MIKLRQLFFLFACCLFCSTVIGQSQSSLDIALQHLEENQTTWGLDKADIQDIKISDHVFSKRGSIDHYYFIQRHDGVEVYNAINSIHVNENGLIKATRNNFIPQLASKINTTSAQLRAEDAVKQVFQDLNIESTAFNFRPINKEGNKVTFAKGKLSNVDIVVKPVYQVINENDVRLAWNVTLDPASNADYWSIRVDATDGKIVDKTNFTVYCSFDKQVKSSTHSNKCVDHNHESPNVNKTASRVNNAAVMDETYNAFGEVIDGNLFMHESPIHGSRNLLVNPASPTASPFGWHDTDGVEGPEFQITRGNNVHAYLDVDDDNSPDSKSDVTGGAELLFDFPWTDQTDPQNSEQAAVTNLFVMNNFIHDFTYAYGFDESAGNFQANNYGNAETGGNDYVRAEAQDGREIHYADPITDEDYINNANFATPGDGISPRMQMYVWNRTGGRFLEIKSPNAVAGKYETTTASFGPMPTDQPVEDAEVVRAFDDSAQNPSLACSEIINPEEIAGNIAMIDRGGCNFSLKAELAEAAGAIGVIICNFEDPAVGMGGTSTVGIPSIMISNSDCNFIKTILNNEQQVIVSIGVDGAEGADFYDGDVDNGIIAHEFGHGISNRLVAGPSNTGCLSNEDQMGEGWSDFFTLVTTLKPDELGSDRAGIGTYVSRENTNGNGIRANPYSTDISIDDDTYDDVPSFSRNAETGAPPIHAAGSVWASMLWDMYWDLVDEYGFSDDLINGELGNNIAVRLVMEGMKMTSCSPGFVDGRNGILAADEFLYEGANSCIIWKAFARRGMGENASQGNSNLYNDGTADYNPPPGCIKEVKLNKSILSTDPLADVVDPGAGVEIVLTVRNDKDETATGVTLTEEIPAGCTASDISDDGEVVGNEVVWEIGDLATGSENTYTYTLNVNPNVQSKTKYIDGFEAGGFDWVNLSDSANDPSLESNPFFVGSDNLGLGANSGTNAHFIADVPIETRENLLLTTGLEIDGDNPGIRFFHNYNTESGTDGVLFQVSTDGGNKFLEIPELFFKNGYPRAIQYRTFVVPFLSAFSGNSNGWVDTWIDLNQYKGQEIFVRFRFGSNDSEGGVGYAMDDFELMDIVNYNSTATLTTAENDLVEKMLPARGIKINSNGTVAVDDVENPSLSFNIFPNPAKETVKIAISNISAKDAQLSVFNYGGQLIEERVLNLATGAQLEEVNVRNYPTGFYFFRLTTDRGVGTEKIMIGN